MEIKLLSEGRIEEFHQVFVEVLKEGFPEYSPELIDYFINYDFSLDVFKDKTQNGIYKVLIAEDGRRIIGFLVIDKPYGGVSYTPWIGVVCQYRGRGIGKMLVQAWEKEAKRDGVHKLMLTTQSETNRSIYKKMGFLEEGFERTSWFGLDAWLFGKVIDKPRPEIFLKYDKSRGV